MRMLDGGGGDADAERIAKGRAAFRASRLSAGLGSVVDNETQNKCKKFLTIV